MRRRKFLIDRDVAKFSTRSSKILYAWRVEASVLTLTIYVIRIRSMNLYNYADCHSLIYILLKRFENKLHKFHHGLTC